MENRLTRSDVKWYSKDGRRLILNAVLLASPPVGMYCTLAPPPCKNDQDGSKYHDDPLVFQFDGEKGSIGFAPLLCAGNYLFGLEREVPMFDDGERAASPLFVDPSTGRAFRTGDFDKIVKSVMARAWRIKEEARRSIHLS